MLGVGEQAVRGCRDAGSVANADALGSETLTLTTQLRAPRTPLCLDLSSETQGVVTPEGSEARAVKAQEQEPSGASGRGVKLEPSGNMSEFWHKLGCCVVEKPQPKKKRRRIDRTMIGEPMNFVHLTHIGSGEMGAGDGLAMGI
ncbi:hypothetical protein E5288_WYG002754 [Bos mutus]|uniref:CDC42 small effector protein 1 n=1 Tax=Bos mutus TaxID=72004 RepID=A0A6B0S3I8_9CETA|nr:hypothetical protein [Bos mutus]